MNPNRHDVFLLDNYFLYLKLRNINQINSIFINEFSLIIKAMNKTQDSYLIYNWNEYQPSSAIPSLKECEK